MLTNRHDSYGSTRLVISKVDPSHRKLIAKEDNIDLSVKLGYSFLTNQHDSHGSTRLVISKVDPLHRKSIRKSRKYILYSVNLGYSMLTHRHDSKCKPTSGMTGRHQL